LTLDSIDTILYRGVLFRNQLASLSRLLKYFPKAQKMTNSRVPYPLPYPQKTLVAHFERSVSRWAGVQNSISAAC
jgi:hypothetical protein